MLISPFFNIGNRYGDRAGVTGRHEDVSAGDREKWNRSVIHLKIIENF